MMRAPPHYDAEKPQYCFSNCMFFRCSQNHLTFRSNAGWCRLVDDKCVPEVCKFAQCVKAKLLPSGVCGFTVKARAVEARPQETPKPIRVPPKLAQKLKEYELY